MVERQAEAAKPMGNGVLPAAAAAKGVWANAKTLQPGLDTALIGCIWLYRFCADSKTPTDQR